MAMDWHIAEESLQILLQNRQENGPELKTLGMCRTG